MCDISLYGDLVPVVLNRCVFVFPQRVHSKKVDEQIFFRLVQYFAVVLFECNEAEDFSPAKSLMNMCFTFYHESEYYYNTFLSGSTKVEPR